MHRFLAAAAAVLIGAPAIAATVPAISIYEVKLPCLSNCAEQGLAKGDVATARIGIYSDRFASGGGFLRDSLASFSVVAGSYTADLDDFAGHAFGGHWRESIDTLPEFSFAASTVIDPDLLKPGFIPPPSKTVIFSASYGFNRGTDLTTAPAGACISATCPAISVGGAYANFRGDIAPIPLPAPVLPLLAAVGALAFVARRRAVRSPG